MTTAAINQTEIATGEWSPSLAADLLDACDDHVDASPTVVEYWGTVDGSDWRVHLRGHRLGCDALGVHWRTGYRTIEDLRAVVPVRQERQHGAGDTREPGRYWIARVDLDRAIAALRRAS